MGACIEKCNATSYRSGKTCVNCPTNCTTCSNENLCESCFDNFSIIEIPNVKKPLNPLYLCFPTCLPNQYRDLEDHLCYNCDEFCLKCIDKRTCEICEGNKSFIDFKDPQDSSNFIQKICVS